MPMKKVSLVTQDKHREESLKLLRKIGVVHFERRTVTSDALTKLLERKTKAELALRSLRLYVKEEKDAGKEPPVTNNTALEIVGEVLHHVEEKKTLQEDLARFKKERSRLEEWGSFKSGDLTYLAEQGSLNIYLYKMTIKNFESIPPDTRYILLKEEKEFKQLLVLDKEIPGKASFELSEYSLKEIDSHIVEVEEKLSVVETRLSSLAEEIKTVEKEVEDYLYDIEFETTKAKMDVLGDVPAETTVSWITGFVPEEDLGQLKRSAAENGWALLAADPSDDDIVPTKLKNSRLVNLLTPLTDFLNVRPGYNEPDISGWFLLFFTIFFGMIFGDAVYGALFIVIAVVIMIRSKKGVHVGIKLLLLLGCSNFVWGVLTATWFGLDVSQIPVVLQQISLPLISNVTAAQSDYHNGIVRQNLMIICFTLALLHLCIGHLVAISYKKGLAKMGDIGSIAMIVGMYGVILSLIASNEYRQIPLLMAFPAALGVGFVVNFVFASYNGSIGKSILDSCKNIISVVLGIANVFSDIMSYIRLWAVGLAGAAISGTVVALAGPMLGHFIFFIFGIIILVFGHGLNLVLNGLSVLVHGVRLNTLEFSSHVGLTWAGTAYKPFKDR
ncbi:MAG: V-type ATP synthase subunit I [Treponema sp.]|nr:V-type ATP synthase subunit I [Treponema sp.]